MARRGAGAAIAWVATVATLLAGGSAPVVAQSGTLTGRITDARTGAAIAGATIMLVDRAASTVSVLGGSYALMNVPRGIGTISVRHPEYPEMTRSVDVQLGGVTRLDLALRAEATRLDRTVLEATPDERSSRASGAAIGSIDVSALSLDVPAASVQDLLTGRVPGLRFARLSGSLGAGSPLTLRGVGTFDLARSQPLVYVDDALVSSDVDAGPALGSGPGVSLLDDLALEDVERVEILRGPAAAARYGTGGASGVVLVRTKRGVEGGPELGVAVRTGTHYMPDPAGRVGTQWYCPTDPGPGPFDCATEAALRTYNMYEESTRYIETGYFPWPTPNLFQNGPSRGYDLDVRGGTPSLRYFLSAGYTDEQGIVWYETQETYRLRANVSVDLDPRFTVDLTSLYGSGETRFMAPAERNGGVWQDLVWSNGTFRRPQGVGSPRLGGYQEHLPSDVAAVEATREHARFLGAATLRFRGSALQVGPATVTPTSRLSAGIDKGWDVDRSVFPLHDGTVPPHLAAVTSVWPAVYSETVDGAMTLSRPIRTSASLDYSVGAAVVLGPSWRLGTTAGVQARRRHLETFSNTGRRFASILSRTINQISQADIETGFSENEVTTVGLYAVQDASWMNRVFVSGSLRRDDSSAFGEAVSAQWYPGLSASWVLSEEPFWPFPTVSPLRIRAALGKAGRQPAALANVPELVPAPGPGGTRTVRLASTGNPRVRPEVSSELELGLDGAWLGGRLALEYSHFWRTDDDLLLSLPAASSTGSSGPVEQNVGRLEGRGWELTVRGRVLEGPGVSLDVDVGASHFRNEVMAVETLAETPDVLIGLPWPSQFTDERVVSARFDPAGDLTNAFGVAIAAECDQGTSLAPDPSASDASTYGRVMGGPTGACGAVPEPGLFVGPAYPTRLFTVAPRLRLLGDRLHVFALAEGQYGAWRQANDREWSHIYANSRISRLEDDPVWAYGRQVGDRTTTRLYDADFWRLREIGVRYALPRAWVGPVGADRASLSLSARNAWTIWRAQSEIFGQVLSDPEYGSPTLDGNRNFWEVPAAASVQLVLRATF